jgi:hypothetical protein
MQNRLFRKVALEKASSLDQLDQLMQVTSPRGWLALLGLLSVIAVVLAWGFLGTIPITQTGSGVLLRQGGIRVLPSPQSGQVAQIAIQSGDVVSPGTVIATVLELGTGRPIEITSFITGRVLELTIAEGSVLQAGSSLLTYEVVNEPLIVVFYLPPLDAENIEVGMEAQVSPSGVRRDEYGFMRGTVRSKSQFPITYQGILRVLRNEDLAREFSAEGSVIEIRVALEQREETRSGYSWSMGGGPPIDINSGSLADVVIVTENIQPINMLLPGR